MYESPIDIIYSDMQMKLENEVCKAVQNVGINVNKDGLIKALAYDRHQYEKGYADAKAEQQWIPVSSGNLPKVETEPYYEDEHEVLRESKQVLMWAKNPNNGKYGYALGTLINIDGDEKQYEWDGVFNDVDGIDPYHPEHVIAWCPLPEPWKGGDADGNT